MWSKPLQQLHKDWKACINGPELFGPCATVTRAWTALPAISQAHSQRMLDTAIPFLEARRKDIPRDNVENTSWANSHIPWKDKELVRCSSTTISANPEAPHQIFMQFCRSVSARTALQSTHIPKGHSRALSFAFLSTLLCTLKIKANVSINKCCSYSWYSQFSPLGCHLILFCKY